jgi:RNA polymerase sigma-70 factor (ECF subfamily)
MVAKNHCLMKLRDRHGKIPAELSDEQIIDDSDQLTISTLIEKDRTLELMATSLNELSSEQKQCVTLFYLEKKSYHEIAGVTGYSVMQVKSYIQNGKRNLKLLLEKKIKNK